MQLSQLNPWFLLAIAILVEVAGTTCMKLSEGFTRPIPALMVFLCYGLGFTLLSVCMKTLELSVVYAIWCGVGMSIIALLGVLIFNEQMTWHKGLSIGVIALGVVSLSLASRNS